MAKKEQPTTSATTPQAKYKVEHGAQRRLDLYEDEEKKELRVKARKDAASLNLPTVLLPLAVPSSSNSPNTTGSIVPPQPSPQNGSAHGNNDGGFSSAAGPSSNGNSTRNKRRHNPEPTLPGDEKKMESNTSSIRRTKRSNGATPPNVPSSSSSSATPDKDNDADCQPGPSPYSNPYRNNGSSAPGPSPWSNPTKKSVRNHNRSSSSGESEHNGSPAAKRMKQSHQTSSSPQPSPSNAAKNARNGTQSPSLPSTSASSPGATTTDNERHGSAKIPEYRERRGKKSGSCSRRSQEVPMKTDAVVASDPDSGISSGSSRESSGPTEFKFKVPFTRMTAPRKSVTVSREPSAAPSNRSSREGSVVSVASSYWNQDPQESRTEWLSLLDQLGRDPSDNEKAIIVAKIERIRRTFTDTEKEEFDRATEYFKYQEHRRASSVSIMAPIRSRQVSEEPDDDDMEDPHRVSPLRGLRDERNTRNAVVEEEEDEEEQNRKDVDYVGNQMHEEDQELQNYDFDQGGDTDRNSAERDNDEPEASEIIQVVKFEERNEKHELIPMTLCRLQEKFVKFYRHKNHKLIHIGTARQYCSVPLEEKAPRTMFFGKEKKFLKKFATRPDEATTEVYKSTLRNKNGINAEKNITELHDLSPKSHYAEFKRREEIMWKTPCIRTMKLSWKNMDRNLIKKMGEDIEKKLAEEGEEPTKATIMENLFFELLKVAYIRPIWQQFRGHIPIELALQNLVKNEYDFGISLDTIDQCLTTLPQQPPTLCNAQAKGMHKWLYYSAPFRGDRKSEKVINSMRMLHLKSTRNFFPVELDHMCFQFNRYFQYQSRFGVPCNCKEWLCENIQYEPRYGCYNCSKKEGSESILDQGRLCLICRTYQMWLNKDRPAARRNFTSFEKNMMLYWRDMEDEKKCKLDREEFEKERKKAVEEDWRKGYMTDEEKLMINMQQLLATYKGVPLKTSAEKKKFIYQELQPFELPHYTHCNCAQSGIFPNGSRHVVFEEKDKGSFSKALLESSTIQEAAALLRLPVDHVWLFLHRFGREKPMWKDFTPEKLDQIFGGMDRLSTHLPPILPVPMKDQRDFPY